MSTKTVTHASAMATAENLDPGAARTLLCRYIDQQRELESRNSPEAIAKRIVDAAHGCALGDDRYAAFSFLRSMANADPSVSSPSIEPFVTRILADVIRGG